MQLSSKTNSPADILQQLKQGVLNMDPVYFCEKYLSLDGEPFRLLNNGYRPFVEIYRTIGIGCLNKDAKPVILVKGRQVGATTMAAALELYFMCCGLFGNMGRPPMRVAHCFPQLELAFRYTKTKLNSMIETSTQINDPRKIGKRTPIIKSMLDYNAASSDSLQFKQFQNGNHVFIESTGLTGDRLRGMTLDAMFFDECFPGSTLIETEQGKISIGTLFQLWKENDPYLPRVKSYNEKTCKFEFKKIINAWNRGFKKVISLDYQGFRLLCTPDHKFFTTRGWTPAIEIDKRCAVKSSNNFLHLEGKSHIKLPHEVFDLEIEDNHNFLVSTCREDPGLLAHNCQDMRGQAIAKSIKALTKAQYGASQDDARGIQVYFGTPKQRGSDYWKLWNSSNQQYYHLGCEQCLEDFPLYTPGSDDWENVWIEDELPKDENGKDHPSHGFIVKCTKCGHEQDKRAAAERGKWVPYNDKPDAKFIGFHINQLYMPDFTRKAIINQKPEFNPINTERTYRNEIVGEFFAGDASPITPDEIDKYCADYGRKFSISISPSDPRPVYLGCDWGAKVSLDDLSVGEAEEKKNIGQSYSCLTVLQAETPHLLSVQYCTRLKRNDLQSKKEVLEEVMRRYNVTLAIGDIGFGQDIQEAMAKEYGPRFLAAQALSKVNTKFKYKTDGFPNTVLWEKDYMIEQAYNMLKKGEIRFPYGSWEPMSYMVNHICSMQIMPVASRDGDVGMRYVKGSTPNDGFISLILAILAHRFKQSDGFSRRQDNLIEPGASRKSFVLSGYLPQFNPLNRL